MSFVQLQTPLSLSLDDALTSKTNFTKSYKEVYDRFVKRLLQNDSVVHQKIGFSAVKKIHDP